MRFVFAQLHFCDAVVEFFAFLFYLRPLVFGLLLVVDMDLGESLFCLAERVEDVRVKMPRALKRGKLS
jgi:hypothetical protein